MTGKCEISFTKGSIMIAVAVAMLFIFAFLVLAVDISMVMLAKNQLQNAADASALAGAQAYAQSGGDLTAATDAAIELAGMNLAVQDIQRPVVIGPDDVEFPEANLIRVTTHRTSATGDPLVLHFLRTIDPFSDNLAAVTATAAARITPISGTDCLKPRIFPDRWADDGDNIYEPVEPYTDLNGNGQWDAGEPFVDLNRDGIWNPGERYDPLETGYNIPRDVGDTIVLKLNNPSETSFRTGWFYAIDFAPINSGEPIESGAEPYRQWISGCEPYTVRIGDSLQVEPGRMVGPTNEVGNLIALDPNAEWDAATGSVINSAFPVSPRVVKVAAFSPEVGIQNGTNGRAFLTVEKIVVVFLENYGGGADIVGRFIRQATDGEGCPDCPPGFLYRVALVE